MQYYRCKCGESTMFGSLSPLDCQGCDKCNTTLTQHPDYHEEPKPHDWMTRYNETTGIPYEICSRCYERKNNETLKEA